jgi:hypothetical protein
MTLVHRVASSLRAVSVPSFTGHPAGLDRRDGRDEAQDSQQRRYKRGARADARHGDGRERNHRADNEYAR